MKLFYALRRQLAINGPIGTIRVVVSKFGRAITRQRKSPDPGLEFDSIHGTDTGGELLPDASDVIGENWLQGQRFEGCNPVTLEAKLIRLNIKVDEGYTFMDFGSGKGRALILAAKYPFRRVVGVEYCEQLHRVAEENLRKLKLDPQLVSSTHADASLVVLPPTPLVLFLYNPFGPELMGKLITNITASYTSAPRSILVIYQGILCRPQWGACKIFRCIHEDGGTTIWASAEAKDNFSAPAS